MFVKIDIAKKKLTEALACLSFLKKAPPRQLPVLEVLRLDCVLIGDYAVYFMTLRVSSGIFSNQ